ncbi:GNAT family N-acetyltransferase [Endozoicomonas sp. OPT23]|uniref:GNAT family N-acetyltransferase n=1 Tax=Endozoicomonas sp. OPT23 TaxID=2072845 RepID=UPI001E4EFC6F|nr:GNAT family N-acetyltransferase [Endozoicomonas sp. OPT23]
MKPIQLSDWLLFYQLETDPGIQQYVADLRDEQAIRDRFQSRLPAWNKNSKQWLCLVITEKESELPIGVTGFYPEWHPYQQAEVGFMLLSEYQGKGYGKENLIAVAEFAFQQCRFHKLKATVTEGNVACCELLKRTGFKQEGRLRDNYRIAGQWQNDMLFGLLVNDLTS